VLLATALLQAGSAPSTHLGPALAGSLAPRSSRPRNAGSRGSGAPPSTSKPVTAIKACSPEHSTGPVGLLPHSHSGCLHEESHPQRCAARKLAGPRSMPGYLDSFLRSQDMNKVV
jgi:hypothetical protein